MNRTISIPVTAIIIATSLTFFSCASDKDDDTPSSRSTGEPSSSSAGEDQSSSSSSVEASSSSSVGGQSSSFSSSAGNEASSSSVSIGSWLTCGGMEYHSGDYAFCFVDECAPHPDCPECDVCYREERLLQKCDGKEYDPRTHYCSRTGCMPVACGRPPCYDVCEKEELLELSSSSGLCAGFTNGTTRLHYEKSKPQFCDERDGQKYVYVSTDEQTWMAENLNYYVPNNSVCYSDETDQDYCATYGRVYDWETAMAACPSGWHLPTDAEWEKLIAYVEAGESQTAGIKLRTKIGWDSTGYGYKAGTDKIGFSALPGGQPSDTWWTIGGSGLWWTATRDTGNLRVPHWVINYFNSDMWKSITHSDMGSVRCVKDN